jgi:serine protease
MPGPSPSPGQSQAPCVTQQSNHVVVASNGRTYVLRAPSAGERPAWDASRIFVRFRSSAYRPDVAARLNSLHAVPDGVADRAGFQVFDVPAGQDLDLTVASLQSMHSVIKAGKLALRYLQTTPNDPIYTGNNYQQWDLNQINMPGAWSLSIGDAAVTIAVVDTGYDIASPEFPTITKVDNSAVFVTGAPGSANAQDNDGHGSNVSGIAAADTNNGLGVAGVGWNVHLLEARVFGHPTPACLMPSANEVDVASGINWAVANNAKVINLSLGSPTNNPGGPEQLAVANAIANNVIVVAASGNDGKNTIDFPAADPGVISVGASALADLAPNQLAGAIEYVASYSNFGAGLAVVAPGGDPNQFQQNCQPPAAGCPDYLQWIENLYSATAPGGSGEPTFALFAGTSQATPHVSGLVALMVSKAIADGKPALTPALARQLLVLHAANIGDPHEGHGRVDAQATLADPQL